MTQRKFRPGKSELGWELYDGFAFGPENESDVYATRAECQAACDQANAESAEWNRRGLADAPHLDAY